MGEPDWHVDDSHWGHASGWAQLPGMQHNVSCVVLGLADPTGLAEVFDSLSDALTEAGYPWEVLMIDVGASPPLSHLLSAWCGRPGFRRVALPAHTPAAATLSTGLKRARGDAVLLTTARSAALVPSIPEMVSRWSEGLEVVRARWVDPLDAHMPAPGSAKTAEAGDSLRQLLEEGAILLDRQAVSLLLGGQ